MIANARMYSVSPTAGKAWGALLSALIAESGLPIVLIEHAPPEPIDALWRRTDKAAVFMCGLPFARSEPQSTLVAAPVPRPAEFAGEARYWSDFVVREGSPFADLEDTFGGRIAFTAADSQSGWVAALSHLQSMALPHRDPVFAEIVAPTITPLGALSAVIDGTADVAPIDAYALRLLCAHAPALTARVRIIGRTAPTPIPALVGSGAGLDALSAAFLNAHLNARLTSVLDELLLERFVRPDPSTYSVLNARYSAAMHYWRNRRLAAVTHPAFAL